MTTAVALFVVLFAMTETSTIFAQQSSAAKASARLVTFSPVVCQVSVQLLIFVRRQGCDGVQRLLDALVIVAFGDGFERDFHRPAGQGYAAATGKT